MPAFQEKLDEAPYVFIPEGTPLNLKNLTFSPEIVSKISELNIQVGKELANVRTIVSSLMGKSSIFLIDFDLPESETNSEIITTLGKQKDFANGVYLQLDSTGKKILKFIPTGGEGPTVGVGNIEL